MRLWIPRRDLEAALKGSSTSELELITFLVVRGVLRSVDE